MDLITLSDLPELKGDASKPTAKIVIGRLDDNLRDPRYGKFAITQNMVDGWKRNLDGVFGGQVSLDFDHSSDRGSGTRAAAWVKNIDQDGPLITADVEFTKAGAKAVRNGDYRYTSPTFVANYTDEHGVKHGPALIGGALTNRPVLRKGMPTLSLSRDDFDGIELAKVSKKTRQKTATIRQKGKPEFPMPDKLHARLALQFVGRSQQKGNISAEDAAKIRARANKMLGKRKSGTARDSRVSMALSREELAVSLGLPGDADSDAILAAACVTLASVPASPAHLPGNPAEARSSKQANIIASGGGKKQFKKDRKAGRKLTKVLSADDNTVTLSKDQFAELMTGANAGAAAAKQLADDRFQNAYDKALSEARVAPSQEETLRKLHSVDPELALTTLASFVPIVPTKPSGSGDGPANAGPAPAGMDDERYQLHVQAKQRAKQLAKEQGVSEDEAYLLAAIELDEAQNGSGSVI